MFIRPIDPIPNVISFGPSQGCTDLVLLDNKLRPIPRDQTDATGIVGIISDQSAVAYLDNDDATSHMFRKWHGKNILLYTDDLGKMTANGRIVIKGRQSRNVKINGLFVDLDYLERALSPGFSDNAESAADSGKVTAFKLVKSNDEKIILFYTATAGVQPMNALKRARDTLKSSLGDALAMVIHSARNIDEMPFNASYKIDLAKLQRWADSPSPASEGSTLLTPPGLPRLMITDTSTPSLSVYSPTNEGHGPSSRVREIALLIAEEVKKLCRSEEPVPIDVPLMYAGLNSITVVQLYFWMQAEYDYEEDMSRLFEEDATAVALAEEIMGDDDDDDDEREEEGEFQDEPLTPVAEAPETNDQKSTPGAMNGILNASRNWKQSDDATIVPDDASFVSQDDQEFERMSRRAVSVIVMRPPEELIEVKSSKNSHVPLEYGPLSFLFLSWLTPLMRLGAKKPLEAYVSRFIFSSFSDIDSI
jgi:hypothetical protein